MTTYSILSQWNPPLSAITAFYRQGFFFNEPAHLRQQSTSAFHLLTAVNETTRQAEARCAFFLRPDGSAVSPAAAPFGSVEFADMLPDAVLDLFLRQLVEAAQLRGAILLRLVNYPHCYAPSQASRLTDHLLALGFRVVSSAENFFLPVVAGDGAFDTNLAPAERRRLRKCQVAGFRFEHWFWPDIDAVVSFLQTTRQQQGYTLTMPPLQLGDLLRTFPAQFPVFVLRQQQTVAALTVAVRVRDDILYTFLPASHPDFRPYSPMVLLTSELYGYCQRAGIQLLDLGVSLDSQRQPKPGLIRFKQNLGAQSSPKLIFEKAL